VTTEQTPLSLSATIAPPPIAAPTPGAIATPGVPPPLGGDAEGGGPTAADLPPVDLDASATLQVSRSPLTDVIAGAQTPARAASLRDTEQARQEVSDGRPAEAIHTLTRALSIDSSNPYAYFYLGRAYLLKGDCRQALTFLQRAEIGFANDQTWLGETLSFEGVCYEQVGQTADAATAYRRALGYSPNNVMARAGYGRLAPVAQAEPNATPTAGIDTAPSSQTPPPPAMPPPQAAPAEPNPPGPANE
jgi:hypothetical protein